MGRVGTAFASFFRCLGSGATAERVASALAAPASLPPPAPTACPVSPKPVVSTRSDALTLLSALQREARLIDFLQEPIASYSDAQVGAAVREVHRSAAALLERMFALRPVRSEPEGSQIQIPPGSEAGQVQLVGNVTGQPPYTGTLRHPGWQATTMNLPVWTGSDAVARVVAPAEVELR